MRLRFGLLITLLLAVDGCATQQPAPVTVPKIVQVPVIQYVAVPDELTKRCPIELPKTRTVAEAIRVATARRSALLDCNTQLDAIRKLANSNPDTTKANP